MDVKDERSQAVTPAGVIARFHTVELLDERRTGFADAAGANQPHADLAQAPNILRTFPRLYPLH
jgi:hypothetical protein